MPIFKPMDKMMHAAPNNVHAGIATQGSASVKRAISKVCINGEWIRYKAKDASPKMIRGRAARQRAKRVCGARAKPRRRKKTRGAYDASQLKTELMCAGSAIKKIIPANAA